MKRFSLLSLITCICLATIGFIAHADVPSTISYRGRLVDASGSPVADATYTLRFRIYDASTSGRELWNSGLQFVATSDGMFDYHLGSNVTLPKDMFVEFARAYLGITVGTDPEISPRTEFTSTAFAYQAEHADAATIATLATNAGKLGNQLPSYYLAWNNLSGIPAGFADGVDNVGSGDITEVTAGTGLTGGGLAGAVTLNLSPTISQQQTFTNFVNLKSETFFGDSVMRVSTHGIRIGDGGTPTTGSLVRLQRTVDQFFTINGFDVYALANQGAGNVRGMSSRVGNSSAQGPGTLYAVMGGAGTGSSTGPTGAAYGLYGWSTTNPTSTNGRFGVYGQGGSSSNSKGSSYGIYGIAAAGVGSSAYGVYGSVTGSGSLYAGYFEGNAHVTGTLSKGAGAFKIDHPLDPANKYLQHSFVESPDMKNVYDGNVTTDANGVAIVTMPDYFETLNRDFRYQLTVIGVFAQAIVSEKVSGNQFAIKTDKPNVEVSWQVTGIRQDAYANAHRIEVEIDKPAKEKGLYMHPVEHGLSETLQLHYEQNKKAQEPHLDKRVQ